VKPGCEGHKTAQKIITHTMKLSLIVKSKLLLFFKAPPLWYFKTATTFSMGCQSKNPAIKPGFWILLKSLPKAIHLEQGQKVIRP